MNDFYHKLNFRGTFNENLKVNKINSRRIVNVGHVKETIGVK